ncbi:MAG: ATP synthase F1 subunit gamma [Candidatus Omnitrophota bacterium]|jgi:F-type H+-transporting ATPase subunit gamma|nr:MAG: ATP synthase F1 subunit gamma [Candidatus Omnitrophota bacterium]
MPSLKHLRRRLRTVSNTKLITRAMRSVSASKMRRAHERRDNARPYTTQLRNLVAQLVEHTGVEGQPLANKRDVKKRLVLIFSADRGLCGAFNATVIRFAQDYLHSLSTEQTALYIVGRRAFEHFRKREWTIDKSHNDFLGNVDVPRILNIAGELSDAFLRGDYDEIEMIHNQAITAMSYKTIRERFLPLEEEELVAPLKARDRTGMNLDYIFEPDPKTLLSQYLPMLVKTKLLNSFVNAFAAEHQARMIAMTTANENCEELMDSLTLQLNKARQASITKELLEIVSGAEALKG